MIFLSGISPLGAIAPLAPLGATGVRAQTSTTAPPSPVASSIVSLSSRALALSQGATSATVKFTAQPVQITATPLRLVGDTTAPVVTRFTPADGTSGAATNANIALTFSEAVKRGSGTIQLKNAAGTVVESFDAASSSRISISGGSFTLNPTRDLAANTQYFVSFAPGAVKDLAGNNYAGTTTYDFRTGATSGTTPADTSAPTVTSFSPTDGATGIAIGTNIALTFSENVQRGSGIIQLKNAAGTIIESFDAASSSRISISGNTLTIDPTRDLLNNSAYSVTFAAGSVKDQAGNAYAGTTSYDFTTAASAFNIDVQYTGDAQYQSYFDQAKAFWEKVIIGDLLNVGAIDDLQIAASVTLIDGVGSILGQATPTQLRSGSNLPILGTMSFDSADMANMVSNGTLGRVILHEMGHVLGLGSLWGTFGLNTTAGQYTGSNALSEYRTISGNTGATYVPLENNGTSGTANVHWEEDIFTTELMTGFAGGSMNLSRVSIAGLADLGYQVNYAAAETAGLSIYA